MHAFASHKKDDYLHVYSIVERNALSDDEKSRAQSDDEKSTSQSDDDRRFRQSKKWTKSQDWSDLM